MAKDKTKPRPELNAKREMLRQQQATERAKRRRRLAINWLIGIVIVGLVVAGITAVVWHVKAGERALAIDGKASVQQITPTNATSDGLAILANPGVTLASDAITVDVHVDYQSTASIAAMQYYDTALSSLASEGKIKLLYHLHISLDDTYANTASGRAAEASTCADTVGAFLAYNRAVFNAAPTSPTSGSVGFTDSQLQTDFTSAASITGDDLKAFKTCYTSRATSAFIKAMDSGNQTTAIPDNTTYASGITTAPVILANNKTVDISTDISNSTSSHADETALLTLLQTTISAT